MNEKPAPKAVALLPVAVFLVLYLVLGMAEIMYTAQTVSGNSYITLAPYVLAALVYLHQLSRLQSHRGHRKENAPWR